MKTIKGISYLFALEAAFAFALIFPAAGLFAGLDFALAADFPAVLLLEADLPVDLEERGCLARSARMISS